MRLQAPSFWENTGILSWLFLPLSIIYGLVILIRKLLYRLGIFSSKTLPVPVIFVGNIRVGGTGKTPCVIALAKALYFLGFTPGIITRGYRSSLNKNETLEVFSQHLASEVGDEPLLIKQSLQNLSIPVWIGAKRISAGQDLLKKYPSCSVIISDDGLQHLALARNPARNGGRDIEIIVSDGRGNGNGHVLPAGPLRDFSSRAKDIGFQVVISNHPVNDSSLSQQDYTIVCAMSDAYQLINPGEKRPLASFTNKNILAVAGIADPEKFFTPLRELGIHFKTLALGDHADYSDKTWQDFQDPAGLIVMTEKDAVKCHQLNEPRIWVVPLNAHLPKPCLDWMSQVLHRQPKS
jgi:tetraacyldisaccharide 4'-kinase